MEDHYLTNQAWVSIPVLPWFLLGVKISPPRYNKSWSCTHRESQLIENPIMAHSSGYEIVRNLYLAYEMGDLEAFYQDLSPDILWKESDGFPTPGVFRSKTEIVDNVFKVLEREWNPFRFSLEYLIDGNEHIVAVGTYRGTHRTTGQHFEARASHVWRLQKEQITRFEQFADTHIIQTAATASTIAAQSER